MTVSESSLNRFERWKSRAGIYRNISPPRSSVSRNTFGCDSPFLNPLSRPINVIVIDLSYRRRNSATPNKRALPRSHDFIPVASGNRRTARKEPRGGGENSGGGGGSALDTQFKYKLNDSPGCLSATRFVEISSMEIRFARTNCRAFWRGFAMVATFYVILSIIWTGFRGFLPIWNIDILSIRCRPQISLISASGNMNNMIRSQRLWKEY